MLAFSQFELREKECSQNIRFSIEDFVQIRVVKEESGFMPTGCGYMVRSCDWL
jgi:hypothetical protein